MARKQEPLTFAGSLEVQTQKPLDARTRVDLKADLTDAASFPYAYEGMTVYVVEEKKEYQLIGSDVTKSENWREKSSDGGNTKSVELTQAEYDALSDEERMNGTVYYVKDGVVQKPTVIERSRTLIYTAGQATAPAQITLAQSVNEFDAIEVGIRDTSVGVSVSSVYNPEDLVLGTTIIGGYFGASNYVWYTLGADGRTLTKKTAVGNNIVFHVYGVNYTDNENYTKAEKPVGTWVDGSVLYQRVLTVPSNAFPLKTNAWTKITYNDAMLNNISIKSAEFLTATGSVPVGILPSNDGGVSYHTTAAYGSKGDGAIVLKYTKV